MKLQISFDYNGATYQFTIDEAEIDMNHYDEIWDYWCDENENELASAMFHRDKDNCVVFEVTADKKWIEEKQGYIISGENIYINVYKNIYDDDYCAQIEKVEVLYL